MARLNQFYFSFIILLGLSGACTSSSQELDRAEANTVTELRFEDYKTEDEARQKLSQVFPDGVALETFTEAMAKINASCEEYLDPERKVPRIGCNYNQGGGVVKTVWLVSGDIDPDRKLHGLTVKKGFVGP